MINFNYTYAELSQKFYSSQNIYKYPNAKLLILNDDLIESLGLSLSNLNERQLLDFLLGYSSTKPISQAYAGHQFGNFTMLGDGRAILIGEYVKSDGAAVDFHLKGAGLTKFSRGGDGKAVLGPMLREYIIGEAMHSLGIPTSRILAVILTGESVYRNKLEQGAIVLRVATSHIRVGTFQYAAMLGEKYSKELLEYTLNRHNISPDTNKALSLLDYVITKQTDLITEWERVGFIHGVMNTDNMSIFGETIDYGPCAFMDTYDPNTVFSSIDRDARYAFAKQASIAGWNIARFAESLLSQISEDQDEAIDLAQQKLEKYQSIYKTKWRDMLSDKLGLNNKISSDAIISSLLTDMHNNKLDYTNTFCDLTYQNVDNLKSKGLSEWLTIWQKEAHIDFLKMKQSNPCVIPRNHQVEKAIKAAEQGDLDDLHDLLKVIKNPYDYNVNKNYIQPPTEQEKVNYTFCGT